MVKGFDVAMDKRGGITEAENGDAFLELNRTATKYPHRYTKVSACGSCARSCWPRVTKEGEHGCKQPLCGSGLAGGHRAHVVCDVAAQPCPQRTFRYHCFIVVPEHFGACAGEAEACCSSRFSQHLCFVVLFSAVLV